MWCNWPFNTLFVDSNNFATCCPIWITKEYVIWKNLYPNLIDPWKIWNHKIFQDLRQKMLNADFSKCYNCPRYKIQELSNSLESQDKIIMDYGPKRLVMSDDLSCNLCCWTCRKNKIVNIQDQKIISIRNNILNEFLPTVNLFSLLHSGEVFVSQYYKNMILNYDWCQHSELNIELFTNATLLSKYWNNIENFRSKLKRVLISLDAGSEEYYKLVRGGNWNNVIVALKLLQDNNIDIWTNMTITKNNYKDIPNFINISKKFGAKKIELKKFGRWWHSNEQWKKGAVHLENHPEHKNFLSIISKISDDINISHLI
jgi:sulfatase maturation enzyme AslB (radical SAM superfamily)